MTPEISRRTFLLGSAGLALLAACGDDAPDVSVPATSTTEGGRVKQLSLVIGSSGIVAGIDERVAFAILEGTPPTGPVKGGPEVTVRFAKVDGTPVGEPAKARYHSEGIEERPYWEVRRTFTEPGDYELVATYDERPVKAAFTVLARDAVKSPAPGQPLPVVASPTTADAKGVNPICTRKPACPHHDLSIDAALAQKKPLILLFSTPALCRSAICGPVLDILLDAKPLYEGKANVIHCEVFTDLSGKQANDTFKAFNLSVEPIFYFVGTDGTVKDRFDGPADKAEIQQAITKLLA